MKKKNEVILAIFIATSSIVFPTFASEKSTERVLLSDSQTGAISQYCNTIRQTLKSVQKSDSYTRSHLGRSYETILSNYFTPLNLRLIKSNRPDSTLSSLQTNFAQAREKFNNDFVTYSRSLEELIAIDCQSSPNDFYEKLTQTREYRKILRTDIADLDKLIDNHFTAVESLRSSL